MFLVDGQHRLLAQAGSNKNLRIIWAVRAIDGDPGEVYALLDAVARAKPHGIRMKALGVGLEGKMLQHCNSAAAFVLKHATDRTEEGKLLTERDAFVLQHEGLFETVAKLIHQATKAKQKRLYNPPTIGVLLATVMADSTRASWFWPQLWSEGEGAYGELMDAILDPPDDAPPTYVARCLAHAWNLQGEADHTTRYDWQQEITVKRTGLTLPAVSKRKRRNYRSTA